MHYQHRTGLLILFMLCFLSCGKEADYSACFTGEVANPRLPYVLFSKGNKVIDTIPLDKNNRFTVKFDSLTPGMYSFKHDPDYQYVYFGKNDSLHVYFDSNDFDRSIVFTGRGDRKNNFMMELFMLNEADRHKAYDLYGLDFKDFSKKTDSVYAKRKAFYEKAKAEIKWNDDFDFYAKARTDLNYFTRKEYYPYIHARRTGNQIAATLPKDYYSFRKDINFNDARLTTFSPFVRYLNGFLTNMAIDHNLKKGLGTEDALNSSIEKLNIADSVFKKQEVKNEVLNSIAFNYLLEDQNILNNQKFLDRYMQLSTDDSKDNEIKKIGEAVKKLKSGNNLPALQLVDANNKPFTLSKDVKKETVIVFWTGCARVHHENLYKKVEALKKEHPQVDFIAINVDNNEEWKRNISRFPMQALQLRAVDFNQLKDKWAFNKINRTIILNANGTIKNAFTNLLDAQFAKEL